MTEIIDLGAEPGAARIAGAVVGESFHALQVSLWTIPPEDDRRALLPGFFALHAAHALTHGEIAATADRTAVAVWFDNRNPPLPPVPGLEEYVGEMKPDYAERFMALGEEMERRHPGTPHHYLALLAVLPGHQGHGLGSLLLERHHRRLDAEGIAAYLEASNVNSRRLYLRHGYEDLGEPLRLPGGPPMFPMWRPPKP
ncbi:hypothetical protein Ssi03_69810 [Sphaerisporangium siamense]|uniref:GNAT superfamily N-acetyltransferase n=1 Tax=Sphaerisporangium siamense TaxID=795645 RepID=A0A7W7D8R9_9ACTN|nr:GNAT family N-acetyltransferase [Sphaerisporangium siamense]MBB4702374.1 GNAT superfamily N-acetyltransferase [Sphaerisporangium siamense]GII88991.1 hypothetical protein Ssi03_69810 [Sphaerisporangium siamense]